jgi:hypothetical protein
MELRLAFNISHLGRVRNRTISYDKLKEYLRTPTVSPETIEEFLAFPADQQAEMKKKSGFFLGGTSIDGRRRSASIEQRSVVALDVDTCSPLELKRIRRGYGPISEYTWVMHSTRKHTAEKPRVRIIVPLRESVDAEEYEAVARIIAGKLLPDIQESIDIVDPCCFRVAQMMYLPTVCSNSEYVYQENEGLLFSGKRHLGFHQGDWTKGENLPVSQKHQLGPVHPGMSRKKLGDPAEKTGLIGAFCRTYDIMEAIEKFIPDCYAVSSYDSTGTRLTYLKGTSTDGACVYDNERYLYSHHHTDPCAGKCVNAFDMVRIHLFGELDDGVYSDHLPDLPSYHEMKALCLEDSEVSAELEMEQFGSVVDVFDEFEEFDTEDEEPAELEEDEHPEPEEAAPENITPKFPVDIFGPLWQEELETMQRASSAPVDYAAASLLTVGSALIANTRWAKVHEEWSEVPVLWTMLIGNPSARKSPALSLALNPLKKLETAWYSEWSKEMEVWEQAKEAAKLAKKAFEGEIKDLPAEAKIPAKPVLRRTHMMDATSEATVRLASENPRGLLAVRDELSGWYSSIDRYQTKGGSDRSMWLEAYGGRAYTVDRIKNDGVPVRVQNLSVALLGGIQPERVKEITRSANDGLAARFIPIWPDNVPFVMTREVGDLRLTELAYDRLSYLSMGEDGHPVRVPLSEEAFLRFKGYSENMMKANQEAEDAAELPSPLFGAFGKAGGHVLRVANVLEHLWWAADIFGDGPPPQEISLAAIEAAIRFREEYLVPMQTKVFREAETTQIEEEATAVARLLEGQTTVETLRDLKAAYVFRKMTKRRAEDLIAYCIDQGFFEIVSKKPKTGRTKQTIKICKRSIKKYLES